MRVCERACVSVHVCTCEFACMQCACTMHVSVWVGMSACVVCACGLDVDVAYAHLYRARTLPRALAVLVCIVVKMCY